MELTVKLGDPVSPEFGLERDFPPPIHSVFPEIDE